jgi:hypothetical protein
VGAGVSVGPFVGEGPAVAVSSGNGVFLDVDDENKAGNDKEHRHKTHKTEIKTVAMIIPFREIFIDYVLCAKSAKHSRSFK